MQQDAWLYLRDRLAALDLHTIPDIAEQALGYLFKFKNEVPEIPLPRINTSVPNCVSFKWTNRKHKEAFIVDVHNGHIETMYSSRTDAWCMILNGDIQEILLTLRDMYVIQEAA